MSGPESQGQFAYRLTDKNGSSAGALDVWWDARSDWNAHNEKAVFAGVRRELDDLLPVPGFAAGGDDYIVKPFSLAELEARVQAHLRREERHRGETAVKFSGDLTIDFAGRRLSCQGSPIALTKKEFDIIALLAQNPGQIFDRERIYERIWGYDSEGDSSVVSEHIRRIRAKIAEHADRTYIGTVWGCGYKWIG